MIRNVIFDIGGVFIEWDQNKAFREFGFSDDIVSNWSGKNSWIFWTSWMEQ